MKTWDSIQSYFHFVLLLYLKYVVQRLFIGSKTHVSRHSPVNVPRSLVVSVAAVEFGGAHSVGPDTIHLGEGSPTST